MKWKNEGQKPAIANENLHVKKKYRIGFIKKRKRNRKQDKPVKSSSADIDEERRKLLEGIRRNREMEVK